MGGMDPCVQRVVEGKNLLLWKSLLQKHNSEDMGVVDYMTKGVPLVGMHETPNCFPLKLVPAKVSEQELRNSALWRRKSLQKKSQLLSPSTSITLKRRPGKRELAPSLRGPSIQKGKCRITLAMKNWGAIRKFVLVQGTEEKLRPIDDALECQLNSAFTASIHLQLQDTDFITAMSLEVSKRVCSGRQRSRASGWGNVWICLRPINNFRSTPPTGTW